MKITDLKVGDQVRITNFDCNEDDVCEDMRNYLGAVVTVQKVVAGRGYIYIQEDNQDYYWCVGWLAPVNAPIAKPKSVDAVIKAKKADLRRRLRKAAGSGVSNYGSVLKNGKVSFCVYINSNDICHARLRHQLEAIAVLDFIGAKKTRFNEASYESFKRYAKFVMSQSASKDAFHFTNLNSYVQNGVWMNVEVSSSHLMSAITFLRMGSEFQYKLPLIDKLHTDGIPYGIAAIIGLCLKENRGDQTYSINIGDNHSAFNTSASIVKLRKWAEGDTTIYAKGKPYRLHGQSWSVHAVFSQHDGISIGEFLGKSIGEAAGTQDVWGVQRARPCAYEVVLQVARKFIDETNEGKK